MTVLLSWWLTGHADVTPDCVLNCMTYFFFPVVTGPNSHHPPNSYCCEVRQAWHQKNGKAAPSAYQIFWESGNIASTSRRQGLQYTVEDKFSMFSFMNTAKQHKLRPSHSSHNRNDTCCDLLWLTVISCLQNTSATNLSFTFQVFLTSPQEKKKKEKEEAGRHRWPDIRLTLDVMLANHWTLGSKLASILPTLAN